MRLNLIFKIDYLNSVDSHFPEIFLTRLAPVLGVSFDHLVVLLQIDRGRCKIMLSSLSNSRNITLKVALIYQFLKYAFHRLFYIIFS